MYLNCHALVPRHKIGITVHYVAKRTQKSDRSALSSLTKNHKKIRSPSWIPHTTRRLLFEGFPSLFVRYKAKTKTGEHRPALQTASIAFNAWAVENPGRYPNSRVHVCHSIPGHWMDKYQRRMVINLRRIHKLRSSYRGRYDLLPLRRGKDGMLIIAFYMLRSTRTIFNYIQASKTKIFF